MREIYSQIIITWKFGSVEVWKSGNVEVWQCGSVEAWQCGLGQEPIWSVQLPYSVCETSFSQVGLFLD